MMLRRTYVQYEDETWFIKWSTMRSENLIADNSYKCRESAARYIFIKWTHFPMPEVICNNNNSIIHNYYYIRIPVSSWLSSVLWGNLLLLEPTAAKVAIILRLQAAVVSLPTSYIMLFIIRKYSIKFERSIKWNQLVHLRQLLGP